MWMAFEQILDHMKLFLYFNIAIYPIVSWMEYKKILAQCVSVSPMRGFGISVQYFLFFSCQTTFLFLSGLIQLASTVHLLISTACPIYVNFHCHNIWWYNIWCRPVVTLQVATDQTPLVSPFSVVAAAFIRDFYWPFWDLVSWGINTGSHSNNNVPHDWMP